MKKLKPHRREISVIERLIYLLRYLNFTTSVNSPIRKQDGARAFASVATNIVGAELAFDFLYTNIEEIAE
jgi:aminopeptidase N